MKPLLIVPLTSEDEDIWHFVGLHPYWALRFELETLSISADRRDAELMLFQMTLRDKLKPRGNYVRWMDLYPGADWRAECL